MTDNPTALDIEQADLSGSRLRRVDLSGSRIEYADLHGVVLSKVEARELTIEGAEIHRLTVNGVEVMAYVEAELDRLEPDRVAFRPTTAAGFRAGWELNERLWSQTVARARLLDEDLLHASVDGEWSFVQTLRHLAFATESWVGRGVLGIQRPWQPLSLPWDQMEPRDGVPHDRDARPSLEEALTIRETAADLVRRVLADLTDERLDETGPAMVGPGWPDPTMSFTVREALLVVLNEEWWHRKYAERDLAALAAPGA